MVRLLLVALGGYAAWRYRNQIKGYVNQLPQAQKKASEVFRDVATKLEEGASFPASSREGQASR